MHIIEPLKMKLVDVKLSLYIDFNKENNKEAPKFKVVNQVRISKYKNIRAKCYVPNWLEEVFLIKNVKNIVPWAFAISDLNGEEIVGKIYEKEFQKSINKSLELKK